MGLFQEKYIYVQVRFACGKYSFIYTTTDKSIKRNTIVIVPTESGLLPAIVTDVRKYKEKKVPYPPEKTKSVIVKADRKSRKLFKRIDRQTSLDLSTENIRSVITDNAESRVAQNEYLSSEPEEFMKTRPASQRGWLVSRDSGRKKVKKTTWVKEEHLWGDVTYRCSSCKGVFADAEAFCPKCFAKVKKIKSDPVWVEEMEFYD